MADPFSWAILGSVAAGTAAAGSAGMGIMQGMSASEDAKQAAHQEQQAFKDRTDQRLMAVRQLRAAQRVAGAYAGVQGGFGSAAAIGEDVDAQYRAEQASDKYRTSYTVSALRAQARNARISGIAGAGLSLLQGAGQIGTMGAAGMFGGPAGGGLSTHSTAGYFKP